MSALKDLTGEKFGRLTVISRADDYIQPNGRHRIMWNCECECGNQVVVRGENLKDGGSTSCGCYKSEVTSERASTHHMTNSKLYRVWCSMKSRCFNKNTAHYAEYGERGITVCDEWKDDFSCFKDWAYANGYEEGLSIDRIDNDGNYSPSNCRWVDSVAQANNRRSNRNLTFNGETHNITEWARKLNKSPKTLFNRLYTGWSVEEILTT